MNKVLTVERIDEGIKRLLAAPLDLRKSGDSVWISSVMAIGSPAHQSLFAEYQEILTVVSHMALSWWEETIVARKRLMVEPAEAVRQAWIDRPAGPAAYPGLVALIRDYWLACNAINQEMPETQRVPPEVFLLSWLSKDRHDKEISVLACMPYWPLGLDCEGNWI